MRRFKRALGALALLLLGVVGVMQVIARWLAIQQGSPSALGDVQIIDLVDFSTLDVAGPFELPGDVDGALNGALEFDAMRRSFATNRRHFRARFGHAPLSIFAKSAHAYAPELLALLQSPPVLNGVRRVLRSDTVNLAFAAASSDEQDWHLDAEAAACPDAVIAWFPLRGAPILHAGVWPAVTDASRLPYLPLRRQAAAVVERPAGHGSSQHVFRHLVATANSTRFVLFNASATWHAIRNNPGELWVAGTFMAANCRARHAMPVARNNTRTAVLPLLPPVIRVLPTRRRPSHVQSFGGYNNEFVMRHRASPIDTESADAHRAQLAHAAQMSITADNGTQLAKLAVSFLALDAEHSPPPPPPTAHADETVLMALRGVVKMSRLPATRYPHRVYPMELNDDDAPPPFLTPPTEEFVMFPGNFIFLPSRIYHAVTALSPKPSGSNPWQNLANYQEAAMSEAAVFLSVRFTSAAAANITWPSVAQMGLATGLRAFWQTDDHVDRVFMSEATLGLKKFHVHSTVLAPGAELAPHADEVDVLLVVLRGQLQTPDNHTLAALDLAFIPAGTIHGLRNVGSSASSHVSLEFWTE